MITKSQRMALILAAAAVIATMALPPWKYLRASGDYFAGYSWIWVPIGHSPCRNIPNDAALDYLQQHPDTAYYFILEFGCRPDQRVKERPSDVAWNILTLEWIAILMGTGLIVLGLSHRPAMDQTRDNPLVSPDKPVVRQRDNVAVQPATIPDAAFHTPQLNATKEPEVRLWNSRAAVYWSWIFTPAFGSYLHALNWRNLDKREKAKNSMWWFYATIAFQLAKMACFAIAAVSSWPSSVFSTHDDDTLRALDIVITATYFFTWYGLSARAQNIYIRDLHGISYGNRSWTRPLLIGLTAMIIDLGVSGLIGGVIGSVVGTIDGRAAAAALNGSPNAEAGASAPSTKPSDGASSQPIKSDASVPATTTGSLPP